MIAGAVGSSVADHLAPYGADDPASESVRAEKLLTDAGYSAPGVIVLINNADPRSSAGEARVAGIERQLKNRGDVETVVGFRQTRDSAFVSQDGDSTYLAVTLTDNDDSRRQESAKQIIAQLKGEPGVSVGGVAAATAQVNTQVQKDLTRAEMLAFPLLFLLSLLFFRSLVAALLPLMIGALAIIGTFFFLRLASDLGSISIFALNLTTGLGLGLAIDYSLFIVSRYREEIAISGPGAAAMLRTMQTAGRTVFFSSLTVAAALASLLVFPQRFLHSMGLGGAIVALLASLVALTVLPAVLELLGNQVNALAPKFLARRAVRDAKHEKDGFWYRLSRFVMRRPVPIATFSALFLIILGLPFLGITFGAVDAQVLPAGASARQVDNMIQKDFPPFRDTPIRVVVQGGDPGSAAAVRTRLGRIAGVASVRQPLRVSPGLTMIEAISTARFTSPESDATVKRIREITPPAGSAILVTGASADFVDFQSSLRSNLPLALAIVIIASLVILFLFTGSVILPIKALIMNALNLSAVFGLLVLIFQDGRFEGLLNYQSTGGIEQSMPILLFAVAFGLSTDYAVFLLSRIKEARDEGASESECVAIGLERTGRIITAAALLFAIAIGAFATSEIIFIKENGVGTALAVLIDATIIRALLVPSLMALLGRWNWWAPAPLRRLHDRIGIAESGPPTRQPATQG